MNLSVTAVVYRARFKITQSIDHSHEGLYLQCTSVGHYFHILLYLRMHGFVAVINTEKVHGLLIGLIKLLWRYTVNINLHDYVL